MIRPRREEDLERCVALLRRVRAERHAVAQGLRPVLDVAEHNRDAIAFYERRGWRRAGTTALSLSAEPWTLPLVLFVLP